LAKNGKGGYADFFQKSLGFIEAVLDPWCEPQLIMLDFTCDYQAKAWVGLVMR